MSDSDDLSDPDTDQTPAVANPIPKPRPFTNKRINIQLDETNFLQWKQVLLTIRSHDLEDYIDGTITSPPKIITQDDGTRIRNPTYSHFIMQDSGLAAWLLSTVGAKVLPRLVGADISAKIWSSLLRLFSTLSTTKTMHLHCKLRAMKKASLSMSQYLAQIKDIYDTLDACGNTIPELEQIATILNGLPPEYESFVAVITSSQQSYTLESVCSVLTNAESRLTDPLRLPVGINLTQYTPSPPPSSPSPPQPTYSYPVPFPSPQLPSIPIRPSQSPILPNPTPPTEQYQPPLQPLAPAYPTNPTGQFYTYSSQPSRPYNPGRGRGNNFNTNNRPQCQLCKRKGHLADRCWGRYTHDPNNVASPSYRPPVPSPSANLCSYTTVNPSVFHDMRVMFTMLIHHLSPLLTTTPLPHQLL